MPALAKFGVDQIRIWLAEVPDPEVPVVSVVDLGMIRNVEETDDEIVVTITPTYSGCPATQVIALDIATALHAHGAQKVRIVRQLSPPWTTDFLSPEARRKLQAYGIAPPIGEAAKTGLRERLLGQPPDVPCPRCGARAAQRISAFGSTPCKAQYVCRSCGEPFDYFKCI